MVKSSVFTCQADLNERYTGSAAFNLYNDALSGARGEFMFFGAQTPT